MNKTTSILLVEDDEHDQFFFKNAIKEIEGVSLFEVASDGKEALDKLAKATTLPDLIVADINMPMMTGIELLTELQRDPVIKTIPLVFLSSDIAQSDLAKKLGARAFMKKPQDQDKLKSQLMVLVGLDFTIDANMAYWTFQ